ncbi:MAG: hypothetical protein CL760_06470 [Chloroflexi bacterium]|nr:hypothetical protein [Chloroflexota bacterium]|tara:strand:+ start:5312 stop:5917 length:606 start_codon:yes stop_codon:yes gene_type:complete
MKYDQERAYYDFQRHLTKCDLTYLKTEIKEDKEDGLGLLSTYEINKGNEEIIAENIMDFICNQGYSDLTQDDIECICIALTKKLMEDTDFQYSYYNLFRKVLDKDYILFVLNKELAAINSFLFSIESNSFYLSDLEKQLIPLEHELVEKAIIGQHIELRTSIKDFLHRERQHQLAEDVNYPLVIKYCEEYRKCIQNLIEKE